MRPAIWPKGAMARLVSIEAATMRAGGERRYVFDVGSWLKIL